MSNVLNAFLNMILVSLPEETFIVLMTLIFLKRFDLLDVRLWRHNIKWIMIPVIPTIVIINIFRYIIIIPKPMMSLTSFILMNILMIYIIVKNSYVINIKIISQTIICTILGFILIGLIELLYYPILLSLLHKPISFFNNNYLYNFLLAIPTRVLQLCVVLYIIIKKNNQIEINLFNTITKNKFFTNSFIIIIFLIIFLIIYMTKLMMIDNILINLQIIDQLFIIIITTSIPIILITWFLLFVNYLLTKEKQIQQAYENLIIQDDVID